MQQLRRRPLNRIARQGMSQLGIKKVHYMKYELSAEEIQHIERYRDLLPEFQETLDKQLQVLFELQRQLIKDALETAQ